MCRSSFQILALVAALLAFGPAVIAQQPPCNAPDVYFVISSSRTETGCLAPPFPISESGADAWQLDWSPPVYVYTPTPATTNRSQIESIAAQSPSGLTISMNLTSGGTSTSQFQVQNGVSRSVVVEIFTPAPVATPFSISANPSGALSLSRSGGTRGNMLASVSLVGVPHGGSPISASISSTTPNSTVPWPTQTLILAGSVQATAPTIIRDWNGQSITLRKIGSFTTVAESSVLYGPEGGACVACIPIVSPCSNQTNSAQSQGTVQFQVAIQPPQPPQQPRLFSFAFGLQDNWRFVGNEWRAALGGHLNATRISTALAPWVPQSQQVLLTRSIDNPQNKLALREAIHLLGQRVSPGDTVIVYWSTHGSYDETIPTGGIVRQRFCSQCTSPANTSTTERVFVQRDGDLDSNPTDAEVANWFQAPEWNCVNLVFIIDQCFAEGIAENLREALGERVLATLSAAAADRTAEMTCIPTPEVAIQPTCSLPAGTQPAGWWLSKLAVALEEALTHEATFSVQDINFGRVFRRASQRGGFIFHGLPAAQIGEYPAYLGVPSSDEFEPVLRVKAGLRRGFIRGCVADVAAIGGTVAGDGETTVDDLIVYLDRFFANDLTIADIAGLGGTSDPDGVLTPDDLVSFLAAFFGGC